MKNENHSQSYFERSLRVAPGGVHSPVRAFKGVGGSPIFFRSASGAHMHSVEGKEYIDLCMSFGPFILGHRDPDVARIVHETIDTAWSFGAPEPYSLELAEWITGRLPWVERLRFVCSGTEAVMSALRVARAATGRNRVLKFSGCYHGHLDALLVKAGSGLAGKSASSSAGVSQEMVENTLIAPLDDEAALVEIFAKHGKEIAVLALEPLPANYGLLPQRREFLEKAAELARAHGALLLFDEVISGFRVALGGMAELLGIRPDLVCFGKVIGGGFPVGCYGGRSDLMALVAPEGPVYQAGTLSANPVGMRAGLKTLQKTFETDVFEKLNRSAAEFEKDLRKEIKSSGADVELVREASLFWMHKQTAKREPLRTPEKIPEGHAEWFRPFFHSLLEEGIYLPPNAYEVYFLSAAHDSAVLERLLRGFSIALRKAKT